MVVCAAWKCSNRAKKGKNIPNKCIGMTFHRFPLSKPDLVKQWLAHMGRDQWAPSKHSVLCSAHFEERCFDRTGQTTRLRSGAVPTIFVLPADLQMNTTCHPPGGQLTKRVHLEKPRLFCPPREPLKVREVSNSNTDADRDVDAGESMTTADCSADIHESTTSADISDDEGDVMITAQCDVYVDESPTADCDVGESTTTAACGNDTDEPTYAADCDINVRDSMSSGERDPSENHYRGPGELQYLARSDHRYYAATEHHYHAGTHRVKQKCTEMDNKRVELLWCAGVAGGDVGESTTAADCDIDVGDSMAGGRHEPIEQHYLARTDHRYNASTEHHYHANPHKVKRKYEIDYKRMEDMRKKLRTQQQTISRLRKKVTYLTDVVDALQKGKMVAQNGAENTFTVVPLDLFTEAFQDK